MLNSERPNAFPLRFGPRLIHCLNLSLLFNTSQCNKAEKKKKEKVDKLEGENKATSLCR